CRVKRDDPVERRAEIHRPLDQDGCRLKRSRRIFPVTMREIARTVCPGDLELADIFLVDLCQWGKALAAAIIAHNRPFFSPCRRLRLGRQDQTGKQSKSTKCPEMHWSPPGYLKFVTENKSGRASPSAWD